LLSELNGAWKNCFRRIDGRIFHSIAGEELPSNNHESDPIWFEQLPEELSLVVE